MLTRQQGYAGSHPVTSGLRGRTLSFAPVVAFHPSLSARLPAPWPHGLHVARDAEFRATDLALHEIGALDPARVADDLADAGLVAGPAPVPLEFREGEDAFRRGMRDLPRLARLAAQLGTTTMYRSIPASSDRPARELRPLLLRRIGQIADVLAASGLRLAVEVLGPLHRREDSEHEFIYRLTDAADFVADCPDNVGLLADAWHWHHAGDSVEDLLAVGPLIHHVHVADSAPMPPELIRDDERLLPGDGVIDLPAFVGALRTINYTGFVTPEVTGYRCRGSASACAQRARQATVRVLEH